MTATEVPVMSLEVNLPADPRFDSDPPYPNILATPKRSFVSDCDTNECLPEYGHSH